MTYHIKLGFIGKGSGIVLNGKSIEYDPLWQRRRKFFKVFSRCFGRALKSLCIEILPPPLMAPSISLYSNFCPLLFARPPAINNERSLK